MLIENVQIYKIHRNSPTSKKAIHFGNIWWTFSDISYYSNIFSLDMFAHLQKLMIIMTTVIFSASSYRWLDVLNISNLYSDKKNYMWEKYTNIFITVFCRTFMAQKMHSKNIFNFFQPWAWAGKNCCVGGRCLSDRW